MKGGIVIFDLVESLMAAAFIPPPHVVRLEKLRYDK
jgi:hypothetical protein